MLGPIPATADVGMVLEHLNVNPVPGARCPVNVPPFLCPPEKSELWLIRPYRETPDLRTTMGSDAGVRDAVSHVPAIRDIIARHGWLATDVNSLQDDSDLYLAGLTSLATVNLMLALENHFDIEFPDSMLSRKTFASLETIAEAVSELVG
jgi:acyl carrier protein